MDQAEKLRSVVKLKKQNYKPDARVITVTSGKGGVGKSNVAVNLAVQMQKMGKRVLVFDADFGLANVEVMFGAIPKYNLADVIYHGNRSRRSYRKVRWESGLSRGEPELPDWAI